MVLTDAWIQLLYMYVLQFRANPGHK